MPMYTDGKYPSPRWPGYIKQARARSVEELLPVARVHTKREYAFPALGPVDKGDRVLVMTYTSQDPLVYDTLVAALREAGAERWCSEHVPAPPTAGRPRAARRPSRWPSGWRWATPPTRSLGSARSSATSTRRASTPTSSASAATPTGATPCWPAASSTSASSASRT